MDLTWRQLRMSETVKDSRAKSFPFQLFDGSFGCHENVIVKRTAMLNISLARNDICFMEKLGNVPYFQKLIHVERNKIHIFEAVEGFLMTCEDWLADPALGKDHYLDFPPLKIVHDVFKGIAHLHELGICHRALRTENIAIVRDFDCSGKFYIKTSLYLTLILLISYTEGCRAIICGLEYCIQEGNPAEFNVKITEAFQRDKPFDIPYPPNIRDGFDMDKFALAYFIYNVVQHRPPIKESSPCELKWDTARSKSYVTIHLQHLGRCVLENIGKTGFNNYKKLKVSDYILGHPAFMTPERMASFEDRLSTYSKKARTLLGLVNHLDDGKNVVFQGSWLDAFTDEPEVHKLLSEQTLWPYSIATLLKARRNRRQHREEDDEKIRNTMGPLPVKNFLYWQDKHPYFFIFLYFQLAVYPEAPRYLAPQEELAHYFKAENTRFYTHCKSVPLIPEVSDFWSSF